MSTSPHFNHLLEHLNEQQKAAVLEIESPVRIVAGAGTGKTRVITHKIASLILNHKMAPENILALTFTNKAAEEMKNRTVTLCENLGYPLNPKHLWISTFHSFCARILRRESDKLGYTDQFSIFTDDDTKGLIKQILKDDPTNRLRSLAIKTAADLSRWISNEKNGISLPKNEITQDQVAAFEILKQEYRKRLKQCNSMDFDDLIGNGLLLFSENTEIIDQYQNRFKYILVDEFQDTNEKQYKLIQNLVKKRSCISIVGDDDQSIYAWRGTQLKYFIDFPNHFPGTKTIRLEQNYRSTNTILNAAHNIIQHIPSRVQKKLWSDLGDGIGIRFQKLDNEYDEARWVIRDIASKNFMKGTTVSIFYRTRMQSRALEMELQKSQIAYQIIGGVRFYERKEVKELVSWLEVLANPSNDLALIRALNVPPRKIGLKSIETLIANAAGRPLFEIMEEAYEEKWLRNPGAEGLGIFINIFKDLCQHNNAPPSSLIKNIISTLNYQEFIEKFDNDDIQAKKRLKNIDELIKSIDNYEEENEHPSLSGYLEDMSLFSNTEKNEDDTTPITLMTIHMAKGLEFDHVYVTGMEKGRIPMGSYEPRSEEDIQKYEEERRIAYVAFTRARKTLTLTCASYRLNKYTELSPFLNEIPEKLFKNELKSTPGKFSGNESKYIPGKFSENESKYTPGKFSENESKYTPENTQKKHQTRSQLSGMPAFSALSSDNITIGINVKHSKFGIGTVVQKQRKGSLDYVGIKFIDDRTSSQRLFALAYTPLEILK